MEAPAETRAENVTGRRIVAALIDLLIVTGIFVVMVLLFGDYGENDDGTFEFQLTGLPFLLNLLIVLAYYIGTEVATQQTVGKMVMGLRVAAADSSELTPGAIIVRNVLRIVDALPFLYLVGLISIAVTKRNQRIGDLAAKTIVVRTD